VDESSLEEEVAITADVLKGRRFRFSWKSKEGGAVNGIALLRPDGRIDGIGSPNETSWVVDEAGRLLFKHADGRVSTRYDDVTLVEGLLCFEGPFFFREGINHSLVEVDAGDARRGHRLSVGDAAKIKYSSQSFVYLDEGETCAFRLGDGRTKRIGLVSVAERKDSVISLCRSAAVVVEADGKRVELSCAPYVMPREVDGLRIQADTTSAWIDIPKRVQFSLWDASDPVVDRSFFGCPLPGYRLFSHGLQAYNDPVHLGHQDGDPGGQRFYHNYGVDLAGFEGRQKAKVVVR